MVQPTSPVDCDIAFAPVEPRGAFHATAGADPTKLEESIENRAVVSDIVLRLILGKVVHIVGRDLLQEVDVLVRMILGHFVACSWLRTL